MIGDIVIRSANEDDFESLCALYCKSVRCNPDGFIQDLNYHGCLIAKARLWRAAGGEMLVGYTDDKLIALGGLSPETETRVELCKLHVDPELQGRGIGRLMTERLIGVARSRGFAEIVLHVTATQKAAINLYNSIGFRPVDRKVFRTSVYDEPVSFDTLYMHLPISEAMTMPSNRHDVARSRTARGDA